MKKAFLALVLLICMTLTLFSCGGGVIPNGTYVCTTELSEGLTWDMKYVVKDELFLKVSFEEDSYTIYEQYDFELNEDKTEITMTFQKYVYSGSELALDMISMLNNQLKDPAFSEIMPSSSPKTYSFEIGKDYIVVDDIRYDKEK